MVRLYATCVLAVCAGASWDLALYRLLTDGVLVLLWMASAAGYGAFVPLPLGAGDRRARPLRLVVGTACGIGILGLLVLGLGAVGLLNSLVAWLLLCVGLLLGAIRVVQIRVHFDLEWLDEPVGEGWTWLVVVPLLILLAVVFIVLFAALAAGGS